MKPWHELSRTRAFDNPWCPIDSVRYQLPGGGEHDFFIQQGSSYTKVFATTTDGLVVCVREYRPGPERVMIGLPGGLIEPGEDSLVAAQRELREETGYDADEMEPLVTRPVAAYVSGQKYGFYATGCQLVGVQELDETEDIEVVLLPPDELRHMAWAGEIIDLDTTLLGLHRLGVL